MSKEISELVEEGTLMPVSEMTLKHDNQEEFNEGFVYERGLPECLTSHGSPRRLGTRKMPLSTRKSRRR